jgi:hypothetical protein
MEENPTGAPSRDPRLGISSVPVRAPGEALNLRAPFSSYVIKISKSGGAWVDSLLLMVDGRRNALRRLPH